MLALIAIHIGDDDRTGAGRPRIDLPAVTSRSELECARPDQCDVDVHIKRAAVAHREHERAVPAEKFCIVMPLGDPHSGQSLIKLTKREDGTLKHEDLGGVRFVPLIGAEGFGE